MAAAATTVLPVGNDDALTVCAIGLISLTLADVLGEGLGMERSHCFVSFTLFWNRPIHSGRARPV